MKEIIAPEVESVPVTAYVELAVPALDSLTFLLERRLLQPRESRLCEYVTGRPLEDPETLSRIISDHRVIRGMYGLPDDGVIFGDPGWYEDYLHGIADREGVEITHRSNCGNFFASNPDAAAVYFNDSKRAGVTMDKSDPDEYAKSLTFLEHEMIHALQFGNTPSMPVELMEYEAYVAGSDYLLDLESTFIRMGGSVVHWYADLSDKAGREMVPVWDNAEYFLEQVDGIDLASLSVDARTLFEAMKQEIETWREHEPEVYGGMAEIDLGTIDFMSDMEDLFEVREITGRSAP